MRKKVWNIFRIECSEYIMMYNSDTHKYEMNFSSRHKAYWKLIEAINNYNNDLKDTVFLFDEEVIAFSNGKELTYYDFEIVRTDFLNIEK